MISPNDIKTIKKTAEEFFSKTTFEAEIEVLPEENQTVPINLKIEEPQILIGEGGQTLTLAGMRVFFPCFDFVPKGVHLLEGQLAFLQLLFDFRKPPHELDVCLLQRILSINLQFPGHIHHREQQVT